MPTPRPVPHSQRALPALDALAWTCVLVFADAVRAHRSAFWPGGSWIGWLGSALALGGYALLIGLGVAVLLAATGRTHQVRALVTDTAAPIAALATWAVLALLGGDPGLTTAAGLLALAAIYATAARASRLLMPAARPWLPFIMVVAFLGGLVSMAVADSVFFLSPARAAGVTAFTLLHVAFTLTVLSVAVPLTVRSVPAIAAVLGVVMALSPAAIVLVLPAPRPAPQSAPPNLVFISFDALRADWISAYGGPVPMPSFERLADQGIRFEQAYTLGPWTIPSMFACFASNHPDALTPGADRDQLAAEMAGYRFEPGEATLAERLAEAHMLTAAYGGNLLLSNPEGILRGFLLHQVWPHRPPVRYGLLEQAPLLQSAWFRLGLPGVEERPVDTTRILAERARRLIARNAGRPYFLWVHFMDPHAAFAPPPRFRPADTPWPVYCNADPHWGAPLTDADGRLEVSSAEQAAIRALYQGEMRYIDEALGRMLDTLEHSGARARTFVIVTSDHGEEFWDHGEFGHGHSLYDEMVRAPLIVAGPGIPGGLTLDQPTSHLDLMPTMAGLMGIEGDPAWLGVDRAPHWRVGEAGPATPVFAQGTNLYSRHGPLQMMIVDGIQYIRSLEGHWHATYALASDAQPRSIAALSAGEAARRDAVLDTLPMRGRSAMNQPGLALDEALREQLRAFGYVHE